MRKTQKRQPAGSSAVGQQMINGLLQKVTQVVEAVESEYAPSPLQAIDSREYRPFHTQKAKRVNLVQSPANVENFRGAAVFVSDSIPDTKGFTVHNCFVGIVVTEDTAAPDQETPLFTLVMEGARGSVSAEMDAQVIVSDGNPGKFHCPLLARDSLAQTVRFVLYAGDNYNYAQAPAVPRQLVFKVDGALVSGQGFS